MPQFRKYTTRSATWLALSLMIFGCAQDPAGPGSAGDQPQVVGPVAVSVDQAVVDQLTATLQCLFSEGVIPNPQSSLSKLQSMLAAIEAGDYPAALAAYQDLYAFLRNWESNNNTNLGAPLSCPGVPAATVGDAFDLAFADLLSLAEGIPGTLCLVEGETECTLEEFGEKAVVYFPPEIYSQLTAVSLELNPPGFGQLQDKLDEYPTYVRILTSGISEFSLFENKPLVVVCFSEAILLSTDQSVLDRLLLGSLHDGTDFKLLATPQGDDADRLEEYCPPPPPPANAFGTGVGSVLGRLANMILPERLHATRLLLTTRTRGGVGGSAEEFSDFGAVDPGIRTRGGVGGAAEEFAPPSAAGAAGGPSAVVVSGDGTIYTGEIGEVVNIAANLPTVTAVSPVGTGNPPVETPIEGVKVTFTLVPPTSLLATSAAKFCDGTDTYVTETGPDGTAVAPCIDFGPTPGYMRLEARMNAADIDPLACLLNGEESTACTGQLTRVFLLETYEEPAEQSCSLGSRTNKVSLGAYDSTTEMWTGWFEFTPEFPGRIRQVSLNMSVSGRASGLSNFPVTLTAYRGDEGGDELSTGTTVLNSATRNLQLPGDNGSSYPVVIGLTPSTATPNYIGTDGKVVFKLEVKAPSNRTPQLWYRTDKFTESECLGAKVYANGLTPSAAANKDTKAGLGIIINNTVWP